MLEFGVNFLTFDQLETETLDALATTAHNPWERPLDDSDPEFMASAAPLPAEVLTNLGHRPPPEGGDTSESIQEMEAAVTTILSNSAASRVGEDQPAGQGGVATTTGPEPEPEQQPAQATTSPAKGARKRKKRSSSAGTANKKKDHKTPSVVSDSGE